MPIARCMCSSCQLAGFPKQVEGPSLPSVIMAQAQAPYLPPLSVPSAHSVTQALYLPPTSPHSIFKVMLGVGDMLDPAIWWEYIGVGGRIWTYIVTRLGREGRFESTAKKMEPLWRAGRRVRMIVVRSRFMLEGWCKLVFYPLSEGWWCW